MASLTERLYARTKQGRKEDEEERKVQTGIVSNKGNKISDTKKTSDTSKTKTEKPASKTTTDRGSLTDRLYSRTTEGRAEKSAISPGIVSSKPNRRTFSDIYGELNAAEERLKGYQSDIDSWASKYGVSGDNLFDSLATKYGAQKDETGTYVFSDQNALDEFNRVSTELSSLYDKYNGGITSYNDLFNQANTYDLDAAGLHKESLEKQLKEAERAKNYASLALHTANAATPPEEFVRLKKEYDAAKEAYEKVSALVVAMNQDINSAEYFQDSVYYNDYLNKDGVADYSTKLTPNQSEYMTDDELRIYNYLYEQEGAQAALDYMDHLKESLNYREGTQRGEDIRNIDNGVGRFLATGAHGVWSGLENFGRGVGQLFTEEQLATSPTQYASSYIMDDLHENGTEFLGTGKTLGELGYEGASVISNMAPSILVGMLNPAAGAATMGLSASGNAYTQAKSEGYTEGQARNYAALIGASEGALQYLLGGIGKLSGASNLSSKALTKVASIENGLLKATAAAGVKAGSEIIEEEAQLFLEPLYRKLILNEEYTAPEVEDIVYTAALTFLTTGVIEARDIASYAKTTPAEVGNAQTIEEIIEQAAVEAVMGEEAAQEAVQETIAEPVSEVYEEPDTTEPEIENAPREAANAEVNESSWLDEVDGKAIRAELERREKEGDPFVEKVMSDVESRAAEAAFDAGKANVPRESVKLDTPAQEEAYNNGRMAAIAEMGENEAADSQAEIETARAEMDALAQELGFTYKQNRLASESGHVQYDFYDQNGMPARGMNHNEAATKSELEEIRRNIKQLELVKSKQQEYTGVKETNKPKTIRTKKSDWASTDVQWTTPNQKTPIAYSTTATSDLISVLADEFPSATISSLKGMVGYDQDAKKVLQQYIDAGYGDQVASEWFSYDSKRGYVTEATKEDVSNVEVAEVSDEGRVLESDVSGKSDGGLLDGLAAENVQEDARGGDSVLVSERDGREPVRDAGRADAERNGRGRSLGSSEGADLQPASGTVKENEHGLEERSAESDTGDAGTQAEAGNRPEVSEAVGRTEKAVQRKPANARTRRKVTEAAAEYGIPVNFVKAKDWRADQKNNYAYTLNGEFYVRDDFPAEIAEQLIPHEASHAMRQANFKPYMDFLEKTPEMFNIMSEAGQDLLNEVAQHRGIDPFGEMTEEQMNILYDEINAIVGGAAVNDNDAAILESLNEAFHDYDAYKAELKDIHQQFKDRNGSSVEAEPEAVVETVEEEVEQKTELATQENARGSNFSIPEEGLKLPKGDKARFKANIEAIKTMNNLMAENRRATPEEQVILSKYVGWGGLANAFDEKKADWAKEYKQLKNLLSEEEYKSARGSTLNAHYTEVGVIRAIYNGLAGLGFKGGRVLEPSAGVGHFAGAMPQDVAGNSSWTMVELDSITGNIAKYLYPNADVRVQGFETAKIPDDYMDMAISNVPFGNYAIVDKKYPKAVTGAIHNYFFAKALDKVRPGGIVCFITSRFTMDAQNDSVRHYIAQRADLLGAIRLPDSAFKGNASTEVVTDILVLKKREPGTAYSGETFETTGWHHRNLNIWEQTNDYFAEHPEMVLGTASATGSMYRGNSLTYTAKPGDLQKQIEKAFASIKGKMDYPVKRTQEEIRKEIKEASGKAKNGQIIKKDGKLYRNRDGVLEEAADVGKDNEAIVSAVIELRDTARKLLDAQLDDVGDKQISTIRKTLNTQYDAFVKKYGILNSQKNKRLVSLDVDAPFILALENYSKDTKTATKADIFTKNTITPIKTVTSVNTVEEGLIVSMNETGGVDAKRIAELLGESEATVKRALLDNRLAFKNRDGNLESAEKYLSGNVKAKLRDAEALAEGDKDYEANVEELRKIIPADIPAEDISVQPGATWIPESVYSDFVAETLGSRNSEYRQSATVTYNKLLGAFKVTVSDAWLKSRPENISTWGTEDRSFINIFEATLNSKSVTVTRKLEDGSRYVDKQATAAAQEKQEKIRAEFQRWLWDNDSRKETLAKLYNDIFNNYVTPKYDGSNLIVNGANAAKPLRPHQKDAVHRIVNSGGNTLLAHKVGAGKTYEMAAAAMKLRQLGIVKKPMFVVPKSLVAQWGNEFLDFFPAAKILVLGEKDFSAANRKLFANRIATGDYDAVILSQEQFKAVPMSNENQEAFYQEQITALELTIAESARANGKRDPSIKQMEKSKKSFEAKLKKLADMKKDEDNIDFEALGVDALFVDEAHSYKNLFYSTNMNNVSGLGNKEGSQKAFDLYMKVRYLQSLNGGRGIVFATATPVMNSMSEMYIMQKYLQSDLLESRGLHSFDAWASQFGEVRTVLEMNPSGKGFRQKQSFSRFKNLAELQQMFRAFADVLTDIPGLKIPTMKEGKRIIVESDPSEFQLDFIEQLAERADAIKNRKVDPKDDNMLKVTSEGRKLSYTQRMIDPALPYEEGNKIMKCADNVLKIWKETKANKGTQLIFCDLSTPKGGSNVEATTETTDDAEDISIYDDIRNVLVGAGVPAKEIAFIHDANTNEKKAKLFKDVNDGKVRVLIGSTGKMGVGMNAQKRIVALHHLDAPWRPGDIEQREGRALRQGNMNEEVGMYVYVTKQTFDSRMWDNLQRKASFIHQVMAGDLTARESEGDGDFALSAAEIKAISSGNPLIMEQFEVAAELSKLENLERAHAKEVADAKKRIEKAKTDIANDEMTLQRLKADAAARKDTSGDKFTIKIGSKTFTERKAAGEALIAEAKKRLKIVRDAETTEEIGSFAGFKLFVTNGGELLLRGKGQYRAQVNMESPAGTAARLEEAAKKIDIALAATETRLKENKAAISKLEKTAAASFDKANDLIKLRQRNAAILAELNPESEANIAAMGDEDDTDNMVDPQKGDGKEAYWTADRVGDQNKTPMRLAEIVEKIRHDFGVNVTTGHIRGAGVKGQYNRQNQGIRTKIANDLPTVAHELGHHLDTTYDLTGKNSLTEALKKELVDGLDQGMKDAYPEKKWAREGLAEYIRKYLQNRETAAIDYPEFTKYFINKLSTSDAALIAQLADEVNAYYSLDADTATSSIRFREEGNPDARTFAEKIQDKASVLYQAWVDANHGIKLFDDATGSKAYTLANNAAYSDAMAGQIIISDLTDANGQYVAPGLKTALHGINLNNKKEYRLFGEYLTVKHGPERLAEGMRIFADDRKNSTAFMERRAAELEEQYPQFKEASERLYDFQSKFLQTWGVDTGLVSEQSADSWAERWEFYVPLNRAVSEDKRGMGARRGFANQNSTIKKARGSGLDIVHPVDNIVNNIVKMVNAGVRNNVMRAITDAADKMGANAEFLEKVPTPMVRRSFDMTGVKDKLTDDLNGALAAGDVKSDSYDAVETMIDSIDDILYQYGKGKAHGDVITVMKDGKQEFWKINDSALLQSVTTMSPKKMEGILDAYAVISRFMTSNITGNNVIWSLFSNFPRDLMTMFTYSKTKNPVKLFKSMGSAYLNKTGNLGRGLDPLYREYLAMGGGNVSAYSADQNLAKRARKKLAGKKFSANPLDWISFASETIEMGPRYATYKLLREKGIDPQEAFAGAMDITVNFRRGGRIAREMNKVIPFFNVSIQGLDKFRRWITAEDAIGANRKKVVRSRVFTYFATSAALAAIVYAINNGDDEDEKNYEQLSNYQKNSYWNIPLGDGKYFAIPKPRELGVLSSFMETSMEFGIGDNDHAFDEFYEYATDNLLPKLASDVAQGDIANAIGSTGIVGVGAYMMANRDFLGKPIVSSGLQNLEAKDQYTNRTSKIAYWAGQAFDVSPMMVDYFFQQTLGGFWKWQKALLPVGGENIDKSLGVRNSYIKDNQYTTDLVNWMYDQADKSAKKKNSNPKDIDAAITAKMDSNMTSFYSKFYGIAKDAAETNATRGARQTVLDMILEYQKATDSGYTTKAQKAVYNVARKMGSTELLPSVMQTTVKDGKERTHELSSVQYVEYQTDYLRLYWEYVESNLNTSAHKDEQIAVLKAAKEAAMEQATARVLSRIGAPARDYIKTYGDVAVDKVIDFRAGMTIANEDESVTKAEVVDIITDLSLSSDDAWTLYFSQYDGKAATAARENEIDANKFMIATLEMDNIKADYTASGKEIKGSRRTKIERYLWSVTDDYRDWLFLLGTEYPSVKKDADYIAFFGVED